MPTFAPSEEPSTHSPSLLPTFTPTFIPTDTPNITPTIIPTVSSTTAPRYEYPSTQQISLLFHLFAIMNSTYPSLSPSATFIITTIAGTGTADYGGDGGAATSATLKTPMGVKLDSSGISYF
jgi:hypothetical protein